MIPRPDKPAWEGPFKGGITQSLLTKKHECPFRYYLYAVCGLKEAKPENENLMWGDIFHKGLEHYIKGVSLEDSITIMHQYADSTYPRAPSSFRFTTRNMLKLYPIHRLESWGEIETEVDIKQKYTLSEITRVSELEYQTVIEHLSTLSSILSDTTRQEVFSLLTTNRSSYKELLIHQTHEVILRGKVDMLNKTKTKLGDHKGKGRYAQAASAIKEELGDDIQMNIYAYCCGCISDWLYDVIKIPEDHPRTPQKRVGESPEQWADRIFNTHKDVGLFPIKQCPGTWFNQTPYWQTEESILNFMKFTVNPMIINVIHWWNLVTHPNFDPNDPVWYNEIFYKTSVRMFDPSKTNMYQCNYYNYLLGKDTIDSLIPVKDFYPELETQ